MNGTFRLGIPVYRASPSGSCIFLLSYQQTKGGDIKSEINVLKVLSEGDIPVPKKPEGKKRRALVAPVNGIEVATSLNLSLLHENGNSAYSTAGSYVVLKVDRKFEYEDEIETVLHGLGKLADTLVRKRAKATADAVKLTPVNAYRQDKELSIEDKL